MKCVYFVAIIIHHNNHTGALFWDRAKIKIPWISSGSIPRSHFVSFKNVWKSGICLIAAAMSSKRNNVALMLLLALASLHISKCPWHHAAPAVHLLNSTMVWSGDMDILCHSKNLKYSDPSFLGHHKGFSSNSYHLYLGEWFFQQNSFPWPQGVSPKLIPLVCFCWHYSTKFLFLSARTGKPPTLSQKLGHNLLLIFHNPLGWRQIQMPPKSLVPSLEQSKH